MKKRIFLNVPKNIPAHELEQMRTYYRIRVESDFDYNEAMVLAGSCQNLADSHAMILAQHWQQDEECNFLLRFAFMSNIPVFQEYSDKRIHFDSTIKTKLNGTEKDDYILTSDIPEFEPQFDES